MRYPSRQFHSSTTEYRIHKYLEHKTSVNKAIYTYTYFNFPLVFLQFLWQVEPIPTTDEGQNEYYGIYATCTLHIYPWVVRLLSGHCLRNVFIKFKKQV
jgi:hypothetical protein